MSTVKANNVQVGQSGTATNNFTLYQPSSPDGTVRLAVGNSGATSADVLTANNSGNVGIGTSSPDQSLVVQGQQRILSSTPSFTASGKGLELYYQSADDIARIQVYDRGASAWRGLYIGASTIGMYAAGTAVLALEKDKSVALQGATSQSGTGITFPATQSASSNANTLDDYEEGTFNAGIAFGGNAVGVTYVSQAGAYVKTGRMVWCSLCIQTSSKGSSTGNFTITGLPFTSSAVNSYFAVASEGLFAMTGASGGAGTANVGFYSEMGGSSTSVTCYFKTAAANAWTNITNADVTNTMNYFLTICYQTST